MNGLGDDGQRAMVAAPDYFFWWYTAKSILLVAAVAALAYQLGKHARDEG